MRAILADALPPGPVEILRSMTGPIIIALIVVAVIAVVIIKRRKK